MIRTPPLRSPCSTICSQQMIQELVSGMSDNPGCAAPKHDGALGACRARVLAHVPAPPST